MAIPVQVRIPSGSEAPFEALLFDISEFGIGLLTKVSLSWGTVVELELQRSALPLAVRTTSGAMKITGRVVHATPHMGQFRVGISFTRMAETDRHLIRQILTPKPLPEDRRQVSRIPLLQVSDDPH